MDTQIILLVLALVFGFYMAWNIGANDVANAMGTSVGSRALTLKKAVIIAAILEFSGALLAGGTVTQTLQKGIVDPAVTNIEPMFFVYGMLAALLATGIWLQCASFFGWPVSTTHAIVGAIVGFGLASVGIGAIEWNNVLYIATSWVVAPFLAGILSFIIFSLLQKTILFELQPLASAKRVVPYFVFGLFFVLLMSILFGGLQSVRLTLSMPVTFGISISLAALASGISAFCIRRFSPANPSIRYELDNPKNAVLLSRAKKHLQRVSLNSTGEMQQKVAKLLKETEKLSAEARDETLLQTNDGQYAHVEGIFAYLQIVSACFIAFAHGANDVANAVGPLSAVLLFLQTGVLPTTNALSIYVLAFGGLGIVVGLATWGWRVIETIGNKITELTPTRGFSAEFGAATTILIASKLGMPVSTTHSLVGALLGVGFARGMSALNLRMIRNIIISWGITIPVSCFLTVMIYFILVGFFG